MTEILFGLFFSVLFHSTFPPFYSNADLFGQFSLFFALEGSEIRDQKAQQNRDGEEFPLVERARKDPQQSQQISGGAPLPLPLASVEKEIKKAGPVPSTEKHHITTRNSGNGIICLSITCSRLIYSCLFFFLRSPVRAPNVYIVIGIVTFLNVHLSNYLNRYTDRSKSTGYNISSCSPLKSYSLSPTQPPNLRNLSNCLSHLFSSCFTISGQ